MVKLTRLNIVLKPSHDMSLPTSLQEAPLTEIENFTAPNGGKAFFFTTSDQIRIRVAIWNTESTAGTISTAIWKN